MHSLKWNESKPTIIGLNNDTHFQEATIKNATTNQIEFKIQTISYYKLHGETQKENECSERQSDVREQKPAYKII